jgi:hypothetical protein
MDNSEFLANLIQEKIQNDIDGNIALGTSVSPVIKNPTENEYFFTVVIDGQKINTIIKPMSN